ncbi:Microtubule-actin cross-linking factor 1 [Bienertia sinuspersici]
MHCSDHPFRSTSPGGGICAFCLQDKLGKLVSSSSSFFIPSSSSSSPSFRSDTLPSSTTTTNNTTTTTTSFKKDKLPPPTTNSTATSASAEMTATATVTAVDEGEESPNSSGSNAASFGRKVSRSRSVGCGSRSFSGDFFERISTGFGDCTLRRVESHREGAKQHRHSTSRAAGDVIREKVRCGGLFGGFMITSSSSSTTSSSSSYWAGDGRPTGAGPLIHGRSRSWGWAFASPMRAFANKPTTTTTIKDGNTDLGRDGNSNNNNRTTPNLAAIPSLLAVRG